MKLGLSVLPLEVWADIFLSPYQWINRQELAQFYNNIKNRDFASKLEKLLHDCGKPSLRFLRISNPTKSLRRNRKIPELQASLTVAHAFGLFLQEYKECEFPEIEMPENIKTFKQLEISYLDDQVLDFLGKIKTLFTNVVLGIESMESAYNLRILFTHFLPTIQHFLEATTQSTFAIILQFHRHEQHLRADEFKLENGTTNEELTVQNACFKHPCHGDFPYVEIVRNPAGANAKLREWIEERGEWLEERAYYEQLFSGEDGGRVIWIEQPSTIGRIAKKTKRMKKVEDEEEEAGPSTSKKMKK